MRVWTPPNVAREEFLHAGRREPRVLRRGAGRGFTQGWPGRAAWSSALAGNPCQDSQRPELGPRAGPPPVLRELCSAPQRSCSHQGELEERRVKLVRGPRALARVTSVKVRSECVTSVTV
jgi:hypothetical protein